MSKPPIYIIVMGVLILILGILDFVVPPDKPKPTPQQPAKVQEVKWEDSPRNPINVCIARGGIPITSAWDGRLTRCQFK